MGKYFPIQTETACQLKWTSNTIRLYNGTSGSCHRVNHTRLTPETFNQFHNTEKNIADRKLMLAGQWPTGGCEYCQQIEQAGGQSDRLFQLKIPDLSPPELDTNPTAIKVTPRMVEIYFDNVCNMSCLYCWDGFSSKIQQENNKFGEFNHSGVVIKNKAPRREDFDALATKFWEWLEQNYQTLRRLSVLGGEPLYQTQFETLLEFLESHTNPNLELIIVTNLKISDEKLKSFVSRIKKVVATRKIKRLELQCSIDCFGPEQEYIRYGMDLEQWKKNFEYLVAQKWITLLINQTLTHLAIKTVPELLQYINQFDVNRNIGQYFSTPVMTYKFLHPRIFGAGFFNSDFDRILNAMKEETWQQQQAKQGMIGIQKEINNGSRSPELIRQLGIYLDELDRRRNINWRQTFPWLEAEMNNVVY